MLIHYRVVSTLTSMRSGSISVLLVRAVEVLNYLDTFYSSALNSPTATFAIMTVFLFMYSLTLYKLPTFLSILFSPTM